LKKEFKLSIIILLTIFCVPWLSAAKKTDLQKVIDLSRPFNVARDHYWALLLNEDFNKLELEANNARKSSSTVADGQPKLATFYAGVSGCLTSGCINALSNEDWMTRLDKLDKWVAVKPNSMTAKIALATFFLEYGWAVRGQGGRNTVSEKSWRVYRDNIESSRKDLMKLKADAKNYPGWYLSLLRVARSQGWERQKFEVLYNEAVKKFPLFIPLYFEMATFLAPRWYGSTAEFKSYVDTVSKKTNSILGATLYARLNWLMSSNNMFHNGQVKWKDMRKGFERIVGDYPDSWNINNYAKFACLAGDSKTFNKLNKKINGKPILAAFWGSRKNYTMCVSQLTNYSINGKTTKN